MLKSYSWGMTFLPCTTKVQESLSVELPVPLTCALPVLADSSTGAAYRLLSEILGDDIFTGLLSDFNICSGLALPNKVSNSLNHISVMFSQPMT
jgi:hypothetical protein